MSETAVSPPVGRLPLPPPPPDPPPSPSPRVPGRHRWARELLEVGAIALVLYLVIWSVLQTVRVEGDSMIPTLHTHDLLLASKISYHLHDPQRGDIVILNPPHPPSAPGVPEPPERDFIKRVIGVSGDVMEIDNSRHPAVIDIKPGGAGPWQKLSEPYLGEPWEQPAACCDPDGRANVATTTPLTIPRDMYFVMGDNRNRSSDSRYFGLVPKDRISAAAVVRIWPLGQIGGLGPGPTLIPSMILVTPAAISRGGRRLRRRRRGRSSSPRRSSPAAGGAEQS